MTTGSDDTALRNIELLLEQFPLNEEELDHLLQLLFLHHHHHQQQQQNNNLLDSSIDVTIAVQELLLLLFREKQLQSQQQKQEEHLENGSNSSITDKNDSSNSKCVNECYDETSNSNNLYEDQNKNSIDDIVFSDLSLLIKCSIEYIQRLEVTTNNSSDVATLATTTYVCNDSGMNHTTTIPIVLESFVSLLGRRGDSRILDIMFYLGSSSSSSSNNNISRDNVDSDDHSSNHADPIRLIDFVYRLSIVNYKTSNSFYQNNGENNTLDTIQECILDTFKQQNRTTTTIHTPQSWINYMFSKMKQSNDNTKQKISLLEWKQWTTRYVPNLPRLVSSIFHSLLFEHSTSHPRVQPNQSNPKYQIPMFVSKHESIVQNPNIFPSLQLLMQLGLLDLGGLVNVLYNSEQHGLSFASLEQSLLRFYGPTILLIETTHGDLLGYFTEIPWQTSSSSSTSSMWFSGEGESFLFQLYPSWNVYCPVINDNNDRSCILPNKKFHQFLYNPPPTTSSCHNRYTKNNSMVGLAIDGIVSNTPRLHITTSLEQCTAGSIGRLFDNGTLLTNDETSFFDVQTLEVWAVRSNTSSTNNTTSNGSSSMLYETRLQKGQSLLDRKEEARVRYARVDRTQFLDDFRSGAYINHLFDHRQATRGRADFVVADGGTSSINNNNNTPTNGGRRNGYYVDGKSPSKKYISDDGI